MQTQTQTQTQTKKGPVRRTLGVIMKFIGFFAAIVFVLVLAVAAPQALPALLAVVLVLTAFFQGYKYLKKSARNDGSVKFAKTLVIITVGACLLDVAAMLVLETPVIYGNLPFLWFLAGMPQMHGGFHLSYLVVDLVAVPLIVLLVRYFALRRKKRQVVVAQTQTPQAQP